MQNPDAPNPDNGDQTTPLSPEPNQGGDISPTAPGEQAQPAQSTYGAGSPPGYGGGQAYYPMSQQPGYPAPEQPQYSASFSDNGLPPTTPVAPDSSGNGRRRGPIIALSVVLLALVLIAAVGVALARNSAGAGGNPSAADILSKAKGKTLSSASLKFNGQVAFALPAGAFGAAGAPTPNPALGTTTLSLTGDGKFTTAPTRAQVTTTVPLISQSPIQVITDGSDIYVKGLGSLLGSDDSKWVKYPITQMTGSTTQTPTSVSQAYDALQNPTVVSSSDVISGKKTWHITGTIDPLKAVSGTPGIAATATAITKSLGSSFKYTLTEDLWFVQSGDADAYLPIQIGVKADVTASIPSSLTSSAGAIIGGTSGGAAATAVPGTPQPSTPTHVKVNFTATFSDLNGTDITITPPPASDVTTPSSLPAIPGVSGTGA